LNCVAKQLDGSTVSFRGRAVKLPDYGLAERSDPAGDLLGTGAVDSSW